MGDIAIRTSNQPKFLGSGYDVIKGAIKGDVLAAYRDDLEVKKIVVNQPNVA
ncbi:hypothetical protein [Dapis sp. BLCC M229]|uniref:hypothetical protein n=1 Tax=Dapis sp. BLCC M229 TaxID=3400188 RepID=UPI003CEEFC91